MGHRAFSGLSILAVILFYIVAAWLDNKDPPRADTIRVYCGNADQTVRVRDGKSGIVCVPRKPLYGGKK